MCNPHPNGSRHAKPEHRSTTTASTGLRASVRVERPVRSKPTDSHDALEEWFMVQQPTGDYRYTVEQVDNVKFLVHLHAIAVMGSPFLQYTVHNQLLARHSTSVARSVA